MPMQAEPLSKKEDVRLHKRATASCVHLCLRKPNCLSERIKCLSKNETKRLFIIFSNNFENTVRREIGLKLLGMFFGPSLCIGVTEAIFQLDGKHPAEILKLKMNARGAVIQLLMVLINLLLRLSIPGALSGLSCRIKLEISCSSVGERNKECGEQFFIFYFLY